MSRKILVIPDKFKGTLDASKVAEIISESWLQVHPMDQITRIPMSDGGDGFGIVMGNAIQAKPVGVKTVDAANRPISAVIWYNEARATAVIETAESNGLARLPKGTYHPFDLDTRGLGNLWKKAVDLGAKPILAGIGGSATNDGGFGLAGSLGWRFLDGKQNEIQSWPKLVELRHIIRPESSDLPECKVAVDVRNPLTGPQGAGRIYGPQKGLRPADFDLADAALDRLAEVVLQELGLDLAQTPGAGAAGGLGFGLMAFLGAKPAPGFEVFAKAVQLEKLLKTADLVITAEGAMDRQTLMGKCLGELAVECHKLQVPCIALTGYLGERELLADKRNLFSQVHSVSPDLTTPEESCSRPEYWLSKLVKQVAADFHQ